MIGISVMTADIFSDNVQTESNRMGIDRARRPGPGVSLTTSSEDSFSFSDSPPNETEMHVHLGQGANGTRAAVRTRSRPVVTSTRRDAAGFCGPNRMYG